jgi:hypothetical protein
MNDRIRELAGQCESFGLWENKSYTFDKEKFAELIVRECCDKFVDMQHKFHPSICAYEIKKHFGVKE